MAVRATRRFRHRKLYDPQEDTETRPRRAILCRSSARKLYDPQEDTETRA